MLIETFREACLKLGATNIHIRTTRKEAEVTLHMEGKKVSFTTPTLLESVESVIAWAAD